MAQVTNVEIKKQTGTDNSCYATWKFDDSVKIPKPGTGGVSVGAWVTIKSGATYYNGVGIPGWVMSDKWKVIEIRGDRAVINENPSGSHHIMSPISVYNLVGEGGGSSGGVDTVNTLDHYTVTWAYDSGDGIWFSGGSSDTKETYALYSAPSNAIRIRVSITPVSTTRDVNGNATPYWTGTAVTKEVYVEEIIPPAVPPVPSVKIDKYDLTASIENITDPRTDEVQFEVYDGTNLFSTGTGTVVTCQVSYMCAVNAGGSYRVRARSANLISSGKIYSEWSNFTAATTTIPSTPSGITNIYGGNLGTSVHLQWTTVNSAKTYDIEYTTKVSYFDASKETSKITGIELNRYEVTGLESGDEYFFRVRAVNEKGASGWSEIKSVVIGKNPAAPTTWSSSTVVITGEPLNLYWVHNAKDGSRQSYAEVELTIAGDTQTYTIRTEQTEESEAEPEKTYSYSVDTTDYAEGTQIKWRVRTAGITKTYGDWSVMRTVDIYAPPTLALNLTNQNGDAINVLTSFPFFIKGLAGPNTQAPIGYHVTIVADEGYETVDSIGRSLIVNPGEEVYSRYVDTNDPLLLEMSASNIDLENGISYTVTAIVSMNSGLTAIASKSFEVSWVDQLYNLDAEIAVDKDTYVAYITPYCRDTDGMPIADVTLSVYRREFDGTYRELQKGIDTTKNTVITDPHPALDYARYRIIATDKNTGAVSFYDPPGYPVGGKAIIIQWAEAWSNFDVTNDDVMVQPLWSGSILELPYNVDVSENNTPEAELVRYIGREYPVSYYGTQIDSTASWSTEIPAYDKETVYALRRLSIWKGDVYVREPSGSGYWANIAVSFGQKHCEVTIPVSLDITRVSGGV